MTSYYSKVTKHHNHVMLSKNDKGLIMNFIVGTHKVRATTLSAGSLCARKPTLIFKLCSLLPDIRASVLSNDGEKCCLNLLLVINYGVQITCVLSSRLQGLCYITMWEEHLLSG